MAANQVEGPSLAYPWSLCMIDDFVIDAVIQDTHTLKSKVTDHPVESGSTISDHIQKEPMTIVMECVVSNTPLALVRPHRKNISSGNTEANAPAGAAYSDVVWFKLKEKWERGQLCNVRSSRGDYTNMAIEELSVPRDAQTGDAMKFTINFKKVVILQNARGKRVAIPGAIGGSSKSSGIAPLKGNANARGMQIATEITKNGRKLFVWFDHAPGVWRQFAYKVARATGRNTAEFEWTYTRGPMLDGFEGTDAQMTAHWRASLDKNGRKTSRSTPMLPEGYPPWGAAFAGVTGGDHKSTVGVQNVGRVTNMDGTPGRPDVYVVEAPWDSPKNDPNFR